MYPVILPYNYNQSTKDGSFLSLRKIPQTQSVKFLIQINCLKFSHTLFYVPQALLHFQNIHRREQVFCEYRKNRKFFSLLSQLAACRSKFIISLNWHVFTKEHHKTCDEEGMNGLSSFLYVGCMFSCIYRPNPCSQQSIKKKSKCKFQLLLCVYTDGMAIESSLERNQWIYCVGSVD